MNPARILRFLVIFIIVSTWSANACPSCYGAADSPLTAGMDSAILVMLGIIGAVLSAISAAFVVLWRRARRLGIAVSDRTYTDEEGDLMMKNDKGVV